MFERDKDLYFNRKPIIDPNRQFYPLPQQHPQQTSQTTPKKKKWKSRYKSRGFTTYFTQEVFKALVNYSEDQRKTISEIIRDIVINHLIAKHYLTINKKQETKINNEN